jgi:sulfur carrier protein
MKITLNGEARAIDDGLKLQALIDQLGYSGKRLAVEINQEIIPKSQHADFIIKDGDHIEIVHAIGGG